MRTSPQQGYKQSDKQYWDLLVSDRQQEQQVTSMVRPHGRQATAWTQLPIVESSEMINK